MKRFKVSLGVLAATVVVVGLIGSAPLSVHATPDHPQVKKQDTQKFKQFSVQQMPDELLLKYKNEDKPFQRIRLRRGADLNRAIQAYKNNPAIEFVEPNYVASVHSVPNDSYYSYQWHLDNPVYGGVHAEEAWDKTDGSGAVVAVVDTGIAYENYTDPISGTVYMQAPDLAGTAFVPGYDFVNDDAHPNDDESHGTHVAGTIAQTTNNAFGTAGLAHGASVMPIKVLDDTGHGSYADIAEGIRYAVDHGAQVINLSLGGSMPSIVLEGAVAYAYQNGVTVLVSTGNNNGAVQYPAAYNDYVIAVGATRYNETRAPYSSYGTSVDIVAPGGDVDVDQNGDGYMDGVLQNTFNPLTHNVSEFGYWFFEGTSMATPHVSAAAAMLIANGNATNPDEIREALQSTADDLGDVGRDDEYGWGLLNVSAALAWGAPPANEPPTADAGADQSLEDSDDSGSETVTLSGSGSSDSDGTIVAYEWHEGATLLGTGEVLVHDFAVGLHTVTLTVTDDDGDTDADEVLVEVTSPPPVSSITLSVTTKVKRKNLQATLNWSGANGNRVDVYRDGNRVARTRNDGRWVDRSGLEYGKSYSYQVCEKDSDICSDKETVNY